MIKVYCYGIFADTMTDEEFYEVEKTSASATRHGRRISPPSRSCWK